MPWCATCDKFLNPASVERVGGCPQCGDAVEMGEFIEGSQAEVKVPWHFWVGVAAVVAYLGWRLIQGVGLLFW